MPKKLSLEEIKHIELEILLQFHSFCKEHNLTYSLCGGSLLGAVRHKGFIPWDDDIDVFMPRPDYERLRELIHGGKQIHKDYVLLDYRFPVMREGKPFVYWPFLKIIDIRTRIDMDGISENFYSGIWIDIFPIDGLPESAEEVRSIYWKTWFWRQLFHLHYCKKIVAKGVIQKLIKIPFLPMARLMSGSFICKKLDNISAKYKYDECQYVGGVINGYGPQEKILKNELQPMELVFEGHSVWGIRGYDTYLSNLYGNYMQLPSVDKRICHEMEAWQTIE